MTTYLVCLQNDSPGGENLIQKPIGFVEADSFEEASVLLDLPQDENAHPHLGQAAYDLPERMQRLKGQGWLLVMIMQMPLLDKESLAKKALMY